MSHLDATSRIAAGTVIVAFLCSGLARAQDVDPSLWGTDGIVTALAQSGNTLYVGGAFDHAGPNSGGGVPVSPRDGSALPGYPKVDGGVFAAVSDGMGGWFIGGAFDAVGGQPRENLAHILSDLSVDSWNPGADGAVSVLLRVGQHLYIGGSFHRVNGEPRSCLADVDAVSGELAPTPANFAVELPEQTVVLALAVSGRQLLVAGDFSSVNGAPRRNLAAIDRLTGTLLPWNPSANAEVNAMVLRGRSVYVGGYFDHIGGAVRSCLAEIDISSGQPTGWNPSATAPAIPYGPSGPFVLALAIRGPDLLVGGYFREIGEAARDGLAAIDLNSGVATQWDPAPSGAYPYGYASSIVVEGPRTIAAGYFRFIGGAERHGLAELDQEGRATGWDPAPNNEVYAIAPSRDGVYLGGSFTSLGPQRERHGLAAFDLRTGVVTSWAPQPDGILINALQVRNGVVYAGGDFSHIGGLERPFLAAIDSASGVVLPWQPRPDGAVSSLALGTDVMYVGGGFGRIGGQARRGLAALDLPSASATGWNPGANDEVRSFAVTDATIYVGGFFSRVGGATRNALAAIDPHSGAVTAWNPDTDGWVNTIAARDGLVYAAGWFNRMGGAPRASAAALTADGSAAPWAPDVGGEVKALVIVGSAVYLGGTSESIAGALREHLAAIDLTTGIPLSWRADANGVVWSMTESDAKLFVGGRFSTLGSTPTANLGAISMSSSKPLRAEAAILGAAAPPTLSSAVRPNPLRGAGAIDFVLPRSSPVNLAVFDLQGRCLSKLLDHAMRSAGRHEVPLRMDGWAPGYYVCRLQADGVEQSSTFFVVR